MTTPVGFLSGLCGNAFHDLCRGAYAGHACVCTCHQDPPEPEPEPRRVQVRRSEVWRTDPDGSWHVIGLADRDPAGTEHDAVLALLVELHIDPEEYRP